MDDRLNYLFAFVVVGILFTASAASVMADEVKKKGWDINQYISEKQDDEVRNIVVIVPEDCPQSVWTLTQLYNEDNLQFVNEELFIDVQEAFPGMWELDNKNSDNPVLMITYNDILAEIPANGNAMTIDRENDIKLDYVIVYTSKVDNEDKVFILQKAVNLINELK